jgi:hypothetical protein
MICRLNPVLAATDRREESDFIVGGEGSGPSGEFLVPRGDEGSSKVGEPGMAGCVAGEKRLDWRAIGNINRVFGTAENFLKATEE